MNNTATNTATCPTVRKQIGKTTYIVRVHFSETAKETMEDKIKRLSFFAEKRKNHTILPN